MVHSPPFDIPFRHASTLLTLNVYVFDHTLVRYKGRRGVNRGSVRWLNFNYFLCRIDLQKRKRIVTRFLNVKLKNIIIFGRVSTINIVYLVQTLYVNVEFTRTYIEKK